MKKKIIVMMIVGIISSYNSCFANPTNTTTNEGESINIVSDNKINKIKWEKEFIDYTQTDAEKINEAKRKGIDIEKTYNNGLSGDFISFSQKRVGKIKTTLGEYEIIWIFNPEKGYSSFVCNETICKPLRVKQIEGNKGLIFGDFQEFITGKANVIDLSTKDLIGISYINIRNLFENKPILKIENDVDTNQYSIKWDSIENTSKNGNIEIIGHLSNLKETPLKIVKNENQKALTLLDGTRIFTKETDTPDQLELFYLDFNNKNNPDILKIVVLGTINKNNLK